MPVSYVPILFPLALILLPMFAARRGKQARRIAAYWSAGILAALLLWVYVPGGLLWLRSGSDAAAQYQLARWTENHHDHLSEFLLWPSSDVLGGYAVLEQSAQRDYPPALYALGVRLKYGFHVPEPPNWNGPSGNVFAQPERGQPLIDRALELGFQPVVEESAFYWREYRRWDRQRIYPAFNNTR